MIEKAKDVLFSVSNKWGNFRLELVQRIPSKDISEERWKHSFLVLSGSGSIPTLSNVQHLSLRNKPA
jgi:hypothetical protein